MEEWKDIPYLNDYMVSNTGFIRRKATTRIVKDSHGGLTVRHDPERQIAISDNGYGYKIACLSLQGKRKNFYVHRLVAEAFLRSPKPGEVVNHLDHDRSNNRFDNLEWCSQKENVNYSRSIMCHPKNVPAGKSGEKYIKKRKNHYEVSIVRLHISKTFHTLEDAVNYRNEVMQCV